MMKLPVHRIIPFSNVEGIGNRTSIFVQGCNANCLYCHNSETITKDFHGLPMYSVEALVDVIKSSMPFIRGITVSGGEATLYHKFIAELFEEVHKLGITCYVDTNGFYDREKIKGMISVTDKFLFDIKGLGDGLNKLCFSQVLLGDQAIDSGYQERFAKNGEHMDNLKDLLKMNKVEEVRLVHIKGYYDAHGLIEALADVMRDYPGVALKLIRVHGKGLPKERTMHLKEAIPSQAEMQQLAEHARAAGIQKLVTIL